MFEKDMNLGRTVVEYCGLNCILSNSYVEILIISTSECDSVWRQDLKVWGGRREDSSGCGIRVYLWRIHVDIWQNQNNIVKLKNKKRKKKEKETEAWRS